MEKIEFNDFILNYYSFLNNQYNRDETNNLILNDDFINDLTLRNKRMKLTNNNINEYNVIIKNIKDERINNTNPYIILDTIINNNEDIYYKVIKIINKNKTLSSIERIYGYIDYFINSILKHYYYTTDKKIVLDGYINIRKHTKKGIKIIYSNELKIFYSYLFFLKINKDIIKNDIIKIYINNNFDLDDNNIYTINNNFKFINIDNNSKVEEINEEENIDFPYFHFKYEKYIKNDNYKSIDLNELKDLIELFDDNIDLCIFFKVSNVRDKDEQETNKEENINKENTNEKNINEEDKKEIYENDKEIKENNKKEEINYEEEFNKILNDEELHNYFYITSVKILNNKDNEEENNEDKIIKEAKIFKEFLYSNISYRYIIEKEINRILNNPIIKNDIMYYYIKKDQIIKKYINHKSNNFNTLLEDNKEKIIDILKNS